MRAPNGAAAITRVRFASTGAWCTCLRASPSMSSRTRSRISWSSITRRVSGPWWKRCSPSTSTRGASSASGPRCSTPERLRNPATSDPGRREQRQPHLQSGLGGEQALERGPKLVAGARVAPAPVLGAEVKAARARGDPQLAIGNVTIEDQLAAVLAFDLENAIVQAPVEIDVGFGEGGVEARADRRQGRIGRVDEFSVAQHDGSCQLRAC